MPVICRPLPSWPVPARSVGRLHRQRKAALPALRPRCRFGAGRQSAAFCRNDRQGRDQQHRCGADPLGCRHGGLPGATPMGRGARRAPPSTTSFHATPGAGTCVLRRTRIPIPQVGDTRRFTRMAAARCEPAQMPRRPPVQRGLPDRSVRVCTASKARTPQHGLHRIGLVVAVFEHDPAAWRQVVRRAGHHRAQCREAVAAGREGLQRLVAQRGQVGIGAGDVGRVRDDGVKAPAAEGRPPVAFEPLDGQPQRLGIRACHGECGVAAVDGADLRPRAGAGQRQRDGAAAGAEVDHRRRVARGGQPLECPVDQRLGLGPRHQHGGCHLQRQAVECPLAGDVGQRFAGRAARHAGPETRHQVGTGQRVVVCMQPGARLLQHVGEQQLRIEPFDAGAARFGQRLRDCRRVRWRSVVQRTPVFACRTAGQAHAPLSSAASCSAARAECRAAMISSRSPSRMACRRYSVRLMRWSVSRPCGKL